jgi:gas vesicle protein
LTHFLQEAMMKIGNLAGDAAEDIMNNHPELKNKVGGSLDQLKGMGDQYGPEAKKKVDETWKQVQDIIKGGIGIGTADQLRKLIQDKIQEVRKMGDQAWQKGLEQAKPYLDKSPKVKELIEQNKDKLMQGNLGELWEKVQAAAKSGDMCDIEKFVKETVEKGKSKAGGMGGGLEQYFNMIPGGSEIMPKFQQLQEIAEKHGDEAQKLAKDAFKEIQDVLSKKVDEAQKLADKASKDAKK